jgi:galactose-1-phosphate uridylyltransferase
MAEAKIDYAQIKKQLEAERIETLGYGDIVKSIAADPLCIKSFRPEGYFQIDPRSGLRAVYTPRRGARKHDYKRTDALDAERAANCPVCRGETTGIIDLAPLPGGGYTFINKNLFPIVYYDGVISPPETKDWNKPDRVPAVGGHFLQWTHNEHGPDLHNMEAADIAAVLRRLAAFEKKLLHEAPDGWPNTWMDSEGPHGGYAGIIKNFGYLVGGSLAHGHQQVIHTNVRPRTIEEDSIFRMRYGAGFAGYMLKMNPPELLIRDYGCAAAVIPYFMKRPLDSLIIMKDTAKCHLHDLSENEIAALSLALREITEAISALMPRMGRVFTYNMTVHNSAPGGLYFEILPYTQEIGGYEHLGLYVCQGTPEQSAEDYRGAIKG